MDLNNKCILANSAEKAKKIIEFYKKNGIFTEFFSDNEYPPISGQPDHIYYGVSYNQLYVACKQDINNRLHWKIIELPEETKPTTFLHTLFEWNRKKTRTCPVKKFYSNGQTRATYDWNKKHTDTSITQLLYPSGSVKAVCDWDKKKTHTCIRYMYHEDKLLLAIWEWDKKQSETFPLYMYFANGKLDKRFEWNKKQTKTCLIAEYYETGELKSRYEWNSDHSDTDLVKHYELIED